ncbi:MAG TPA: hypothetical protein VIB39_04355 [Candidatus Angelobacter sp.]|jgi:hypothetical protein
MTKEEILKAIRVCARKLKRSPKLHELRAMAGVTEKVLYTRLGCLGKALEAAGLQASGAGFNLTEDALLKDWAAVARKLKKLPSISEYRQMGKCSDTPFRNRYGSWVRVPEAFASFVRRSKNKALIREWRAVLEMIEGNGSGTQQARATGNQSRLRRQRRGLMVDRPVYGMPLHLPEMAYAPMNEAGVMFLFALMARRLGFVVQRLQTGFPDCEAMREVAPGQCQRVWIEFEFESKNFAKHRHRRDGCDLIVCWRHNWKECPMEVIALSDQLNLKTHHGDTETRRKTGSAADRRYDANKNPS